MRWLLLFLLFCAVLWFIREVPDHKPPPIEEGIIGGPVKALHKAQGFEKSYLDADAEHQRQMEEQIEKDAGG